MLCVHVLICEACTQMYMYEPLPYSVLFIIHVHVHVCFHSICSIVCVAVLYLESCRLIILHNHVLFIFELLCFFIP